MVKKYDHENNNHENVKTAKNNNKMLEMYWVNSTDNFVLLCMQVDVSQGLCGLKRLGMKTRIWSISACFVI